VVIVVMIMVVVVIVIILSNQVILKQPMMWQNVRITVWALINHVLIHIIASLGMHA
jgi:hypothetical protein